ncbi:MAG: RNA pyrophosphohydrolase [Hirschia sp.]|nr:RNA pyrophosphohydrolase [Hirschia sp.]MBF18994.1 RNA pyrophosphohydrolase [Hirschia sp.]|tara:strand:- start:947 stop:1447 length:501 start_codon:yes stop_codon:yes gene_type:complete
MTTTNPEQGDRKPEHYRPNAGLAIFSGAGQVFMGRRVGSRGPYQWQMPQGGIDKGEDHTDAAFRELEEETGLGRSHVELLHEMEEWLYYDFPPELKSRLGGPYLGQRQKWFAFRLIGSESDIRLDLHQPEFDAWKWVDLVDAPDAIIPFKRPVYDRVVTAFSQWTS